MHEAGFNPKIRGQEFSEELKSLSEGIKEGRVHARKGPAAHQANSNQSWPGPFSSSMLPHWGTPGYFLWERHSRRQEKSTELPPGTTHETVHTYKLL